MSDNHFQKLLKHFSYQSRARKFALLSSVFEARPRDRVLDVGASGEVFLRYTFEDVYPFPERIVAGGAMWDEIASTPQYYPKAQYVVFDWCALPFPDQSLD